MAQGIYDKDGFCKRCRGTNKCPNCNGTGHVVPKSGFYKGEEVPCPLCFGGGDCKLCHGKKNNSFSYLPSKEVIK